MRNIGYEINRVYGNLDTDIWEGIDNGWFDSKGNSKQNVRHQLQMRIWNNIGQNISLDVYINIHSGNFIRTTPDAEHFVESRIKSQ